MIDLDRRAIRFPRDGHILIPRGDRKAAAGGLAMQSPCRPSRVLAQRVLYLGVRTFGTWLVPGRHEVWSPPMAEDQWAELLAHWSEHIAGFDSIALYYRPQATRSGFAARLFRDGQSVAFARWNPDRSRTDRELAVLTALAAGNPRAFRAALPIASGAGWLLTSSTPGYPLGGLSRPTPMMAIAAEISDILTGSLPRPPGTDPSWVGAHGDLTPWNVRTAIGAVWVIDWEDARYAPRGADQLYAALTIHTTFGTPLPRSAPAEAISWVVRLMNERIESGMPTPENQSLLKAARSIPAQ